MRRRSEGTRARIVDAAYDCFWRSGYTRTNVDRVAARAGVTKRTLYGYFRSKDDLLAAALAHYAELAEARLDRIGARAPLDGRGLVASLFEQLTDWARDTPRWSGSGMSRLAVELSDLPGHPARMIARGAKTAMETWLARRLTRARMRRPRQRAREVALLIEGAMVLTIVHGGRDYMDAASRAAQVLLSDARRAR